MRKIPIILFMLLMAWSSHAQVAKVQNNPDYDFKLIHFGFTVGLNTMDFGIRRPGPDMTDYIADVSNISPGFQVSIVSELRLGEYFTLRFLPGITFGQRTLNFFLKTDSTLDRKMQIESNFLDFPLLIKYKSKRVNNYRPYFVGGANVRYDLAARKNDDKEDYARLKPFDVYLEAGFGVDFYLKYFKFSPELKLSVGMRNILKQDPGVDTSEYVNAIDRLNSYVVMLCFHFE